MRSFYKVTTLLREQLASNEDVNTVMFGAFDQADLQKKNIYPLAVINPVSASLDNGNVNQFEFEIGVFDQRDLSDDEIVDKFVSNDNEIDNLNTCHAVLNKLITYLRNEYNEDNIQLVNTTSLEPLIYTDKNILDGWSINITLEIPNTTINSCS